MSDDGWSKDNEKNINIYSVKQACDNDEEYENGIWYKERWINENGIEQRIIVSFSPKHRVYQRHIRNSQI